MEEPNEENSFTPREYQLEILEAAKERNTIACLGTGTGKTFIAILLIKENASAVRKPYEEDGKRIFFLVPTVPLATQQASTISRNTDLKVKAYYGDLGVDTWDDKAWLEEFTNFEVLVMTAEIFRVIVDHRFIRLNKIQLIILDECHRANKDHPYRMALNAFPADFPEMPRIFGLSASLVNGKCEPIKLEKELKKLETTLRSTISTASDVADLRRYGTDPKECIILHKNTVCGQEFQELIGASINLIGKIDIKKASSVPNNLYSCADDDDIQFFKKPVQCLKSLNVILSTLGTWCAMKAGLLYKKEAETLLRKKIPEMHRDVIQEILSFLDNFCEKLQTSAATLSLDDMPHKLKSLLKILSAAKRSRRFRNVLNVVEEVAFEENPQRFYELQKSQPEVQLSILIFVQQRVTAYVLHQWLEEISREIPELSFLKSEFVVGHGTTGISGASMSEKMQQKKLKSFRENRTNVLVATQVLEEGMDIRQCNLVIRFDKPGDFRAYVQSKGRARARNSVYAMLLEEGQCAQEFISDLHSFKTIEAMLMTKCHNRNTPTEEEITEAMCDFEIAPYVPKGPDGPRITATASISLINRYCATLPSDMATRLTPQFKIKEIDEDSPVTEYVCTLRMPINSPLRAPIVGDPMKRKKLAKMSAALKACKMLDELEELNEKLIPKTSLALDNAIEAEVGVTEIEDGKGAMPGTNSRRQAYKKRIPVCMQDAKPRPNKPCYLHILKLDLIVPLPKTLNPRERPIRNPELIPRGIGFLSAKKWPLVCPFTIFTKIGKILVSLSVLEKPVAITAENVEEIEKFHQFMFSDALFLQNPDMFAPNLAETAYYVVPVNKDRLGSPVIDWQFIQSTNSHPYHRNKLLEVKPRAKFTESEFSDAVVVKTYRRLDVPAEDLKPSFFHVVGIRYHLSPLSNIDKDKNFTYKDLFRNAYQIEVKDECQPLVEVIEYASKSFWKPIYKNVKQTFDDDEHLSNTKQKKRDYTEHLIPELCLVHPFPSPFFFKVLCVPTALFRLGRLYLAEELRQQVSRETGVGSDAENHLWPPFRLETSDRKLVEKLVEKNQVDASLEKKTPLVPVDIAKDRNGNIRSFEVIVLDPVGPSPDILLKALTALGSGDEFDLERLEIIGDSFLKYVMTLKIYVKYFRMDEGKLTQLRIRLIQNLRLYQQATKRRLGEYLTNTPFDVSRTWLPPCYAVEDYISDGSLNRNKKIKLEDPEAINEPQHLYFTQQVISDKSIADSVEALIGAYLLTCGTEGALKFMRWMHLNPPSEEEWYSTDVNPVINKSASNLESLTDGFDRFESTIGYTFKNKAYLLQAFTHPSYFYNDVTDCYQRLEFLGDAVLDYLITRQLYEHPGDYSPGRLTDLRSALVNNVYFAWLAVTKGFDKFFKSCSSTLFNLIDTYTRALRQTEAFQFFEMNFFTLSELECFELDEVEVPKALGDLFESVAGAIFLDSGRSLDAVWKVFYPWIEPAMKYYHEHIPLPPIRELHELLPGRKNIFSEAIHQNDKTYIHVILPDGQLAQGVGPNKKVAKNSAAKRALKILKIGAAQ